MQVTADLTWVCCRELRGDEYAGLAKGLGDGNVGRWVTKRLLFSLVASQMSETYSQSLTDVFDATSKPSCTLLSFVWNIQAVHRTLGGCSENKLSQLCA